MLVLRCKTGISCLEMAMTAFKPTSVVWPQILPLVTFLSTPSKMILAFRTFPYNPSGSDR
jgi:hypothetical protein